ncbi:MAG: hypothetical protein ABL886_02735 [Rhodoglobus sp.]
MTRTPTRAVLLDPRLVIGVLLVVGSIAGVVGIVSTADRTVEVYAAAAALSPGDRVRSGDLRVHNVRLDAATARYLVPGDIPAEGVIVTRPLSTGELIPVSAVGDVDGGRLAPLVLRVESSLAASVTAGATVDVWASRRNGDRTFVDPAVIVSGAVVVRLVESRTIVVAGDVTAIEVLVPRSRIAVVLEAIANEASISIVPTSIPLGD